MLRARPPALAARTNRTRLFMSEHSFIKQVKMPRPRRISNEDVLAGALRVMFRKGPSEFTLAAVAAEVDSCASHAGAAVWR